MNKKQYNEVMQKAVECSTVACAIELLENLTIYDVKHVIDDLDSLLDTIGSELQWKEELGK